METKYITIPFDVQRAKRISNGEEEGKIVTRDGRNVRIVCWDAKSDDSIIALVEDKNGVEYPYSYLNNGSYHIGEKNDIDIMLAVPEWTTFKDGDIVTMGWENGDHYCKWISIIKVIDVFDNDICTRDYVTVCISADFDNCFSIAFDSESDAAKWVRNATEKEIQILVEEIKESTEPKAKEYLKRFFGIKETTNHSNTEKTGKEFELKPFDKVLVRDYYGSMWKASFFSHLTDNEKFPFSCGGFEWRYCIPYEGNEHLLGTSNDPE